MTSIGTDRLSGGTASFGTFQTLPSSIVAEGLGRMGYDFVIVDLQHGSATWDGLLDILIALEKGGTVPLVRVGWNDPMQIMRALDLGAAGVVVPMVSTVEEARQVVAASHYAPAGYRSIGPIRHQCVPTGHGYSPEAMDRQILALPMIETAEGLANVDEIAAIPGVGGLFIGPYDLALSLGLGFAVDSQPMLDAFDRIIAACNRNNIIAGTISLSPEGVEALYRKGMHLVALGSDLAMIAAAARTNVAQAPQLKESFRPAPLPASAI